MRFQKSLEGWDTWNPVKLISNQDGGKIATLEYSLLAQAVNVEAGTKYEIGGYMISEGAPDWLQWAVIFYDDKGLEISTESDRIAESSTLARIKGEMVAPVGAKVALVTFWAGRGGKLLLDDLCFSKLGGDIGGGGNENTEAFDIQLSNPSSVNAGAFSFKLVSSELIDVSEKAIGSNSFSVNGGRITGVASIGQEFNVMAKFAEGVESISITFLAGAAKSSTGGANAVSNTITVTREIDPGNTGGKSLSAGNIGTDSSGKSVSFEGPFTSALVSQTGHKDLDGGIATIKFISDSGIEINIKEDQENDREMVHAAEQVGYLIVK